MASDRAPKAQQGLSLGPRLEYPGIFDGHENSIIQHDTVNILDMGSFLEDGYPKLTKQEKERGAAEAERFGTHGFSRFRR